MKIVRDIYGSILSIDDCQAQENPATHLVICSYTFNKKTRPTDGLTSHLNVSPNRQFMYITKSAAIKDHTVINMFKHVEQVLICRKEGILVVLNDNGGYVFFRHDRYSEEFYDFIVASYSSVEDASIEDVHNKMTGIDESRSSEKQSEQEPHTYRFSKDLEKKASPSFPRIPPEVMYSSEDAVPILARKTRSRMVSPETISLVPLESPAPFVPPLQYKFPDGKPFIVTQSDFKTLYNNDWVNDTIIDFFIKFEIQQAVHNGNMKQEDVYAFNSFFFLKLMSNPENFQDRELIGYYQNVTRWVSKIDLFSYQNLIIPINESSHWYGCLIVGLPDYLERAKTLKELNESQAHDYVGNSTDVVEPEVHSIFESRFKNKVNIFVFDSLGQKHVRIHHPFKNFLMEYCKDRYGIEMERSDIVFRSTKVPKQNNFNDCGIHVIYNIRKYLNARAECLSIWNKGSSQYKAFFKSSERAGMRKELIQLLLKLHNEDNPDKNKEEAGPENSENGVGSETDTGTNVEAGSKVSKESSSTADDRCINVDSGNEKGCGSEDDEIEVVQVKNLDNVRQHRIKARGRNGTNRLFVTIANGVNLKADTYGVDQKKSSNECIQELVDGIGERSNWETTERETDDINENLSNQALKESRISNDISAVAVQILNELFPDPRETFTSNQILEITKFIKDINHLTFKRDSQKVEHLKKAFRETYDRLDPSRPMNAEFKITFDTALSKKTSETNHDDSDDTDALHETLSINSGSHTEGVLRTDKAYSPSRRWEYTETQPRDKRQRLS
ncbi:ubiquitin-like-specific protease [Yamadazyma tenuis]|nr:ubiquitin-like-specific protease [Yamadazyma tenuis]